MIYFQIDKDYPDKSFLYFTDTSIIQEVINYSISAGIKFDASNNSHQGFIKGFGVNDQCANICELNSNAYGEEQSISLVQLFKIFDEVTIVKSNDGGVDRYKDTVERIISGNKKARTR